MSSFIVPRRSAVLRGTMTALAVLLAFSPVMNGVARAQEGPSAYDDGGDQYAGDPPTRVGRLARVQGTVSFHTADGTQWDPAIPNYPLTSGNALWTEPGSSATVDVSTTRLVMDGATELDIDTLDDRNMSADLAQGRVYVRVRGLLPGESYSVRTPRGTVTLDAPGRYEIVAGDTESPTRIIVLEGAARVSGQGLSLSLNGGQTGEITGDTPPNVNVRPADHDSFLVAMLRADRVGSSPPPPAVVAAMPGADDLDDYGSWQATPQYGQVWYPQVDPGWVPYRDGHWAYVAPWGWTWIDNAPWGFAPFHYGRWVDVGGRWAWAPAGAVVTVGPPPPPVYAPALVAFFGAGVAIGVSIGGPHYADHPPVGWCPLGWQEPYHPWYRASPRYVEYVNRPVVRDITVIHNVTNVTNVTNITINNFANRRGASMMPADAMVAGRFGPRDGGARPWDGRQFADARMVVGRPPVQPTAATLGVTPQMAQRLHLPGPPPGIGGGQPPPSPGPQFQPHPPGGPSRPLDLRGPGGGPHPDAAQAGAFRPGDPRGDRPGFDHAGGIRALDRRADEPGFRSNSPAPNPSSPNPMAPNAPAPNAAAQGRPMTQPGASPASPLPPLANHNQPPGPPAWRGRPGPSMEPSAPHSPTPTPPAPGQSAAPPPQHPAPAQPQPQSQAAHQPERPQQDFQRDFHRDFQRDFRRDTPQPAGRPEGPQMRPQSPPEPQPHRDAEHRPQPPQMPPPHMPPPQARPEPPHAPPPQQHPQQPQHHPEPQKPQPAPGRNNDAPQPHSP
ncbi:DUF6600 domain-containing protein [Nitrospirillum pindoramense]|uniref:FecR family protein n=1 Tax=Nitrospirillum amazonense TaxID=28077 RepID=A0A560HAL3_9PROT|nr:DUF6600 domain-containing protein [Nitrospirillum amazonense]TWB42654.1 FecR family protein [Nitrospirillum amazonense]